MSRRLLQIVTALLGLVPVLTGVLTMFGVKDPLYAGSGLAAIPLLDSNLRFFGGIWLALGLAVWSLVPAIERQGTAFRAIWGAIFLGGIGRLLSILLIGYPPLPFVGFTALEIIGAPLFVYWQHRVAKAHAHPMTAAAQRRADLSDLETAA
jgi:Domain of unknown function (DUF4345)